MPDPVVEPDGEEAVELLVREIDIPLVMAGREEVTELVEVASSEEGTGIADVNDEIPDPKEPDIWSSL